MERTISRAIHGWSMIEEIKWEINQLEIEIDDHEAYCDAAGLPYDDEQEKARLAELRKELEGVK